MSPAPWLETSRRPPAVCTSGECVLHETESWEPTWRVGRDPVAELDDPVAFSPDSSQVAVTHGTRDVRLLDWPAPPLGRRKIEDAPIVRVETVE